GHPPSNPGRGSIRRPGIPWPGPPRHPTCYPGVRGADLPQKARPGRTPPRLPMTRTASSRPPGCPVLAALAAGLALAPVARAAEPWTALADPDNSLSFRFLRSGQPVFRVGLAGWGPKWAWVGLQSGQKADGERLSAGVPFVVNKDTGEVINVRFEAS